MDRKVMTDDGKKQTGDRSIKTDYCETDLMFVLHDTGKENDFRDEKTENEILVYCISNTLQISGKIKQIFSEARKLFR